MKRILHFLNAVLFLSFFSCTNDKSSLAELRESAFVNISFALSSEDFKAGITDDSTIIFPVFSRSNNMSEISSEFNPADYNAKIVLRYYVPKDDSGNGVYETFVVPIRVVALNSGHNPVIVTEPLSLLRPLNNHKHVLEGIFIESKGDDPEIIFSTITSGSIYASSINREHRMPINLFVDDGDGISADEIEKLAIPISILCAK